MKKKNKNKGIQLKDLAPLSNDTTICQIPASIWDLKEGAVFTFHTGEKPRFVMVRNTPSRIYFKNTVLNKSYDEVKNGNKHEVFTPQTALENE